jgi:hypothetical protein
VSAVPDPVVDAFLRISADRGAAEIVPPAAALPGDTKLVSDALVSRLTPAEASLVADVMFYSPTFVLSSSAPAWAAYEKLLAIAGAL